MNNSKRGGILVGFRLRYGSLCTDQSTWRSPEGNLTKLMSYSWRKPPFFHEIVRGSCKRNQMLWCRPLGSGFKFQKARRTDSEFPSCRLFFELTSIGDWFFPWLFTRTNEQQVKNVSVFNSFFMRIRVWPMVGLGESRGISKITSGPSWADRVRCFWFVFE